MEPASAPMRLRTPKETAVILGTTEKTLSGNRNKGTGCKYIKQGPHRKSSVKYRDDDIQAYIDSFERQGSGA
jgi:hypothetical protein